MAAKADCNIQASKVNYRIIRRTLNPLAHSISQDAGWFLPPEESTGCAQHERIGEPDHLDCPNCQWDLAHEIYRTGCSAQLWIKQRKARGLRVPRFLQNAVSRAKDVKEFLAACFYVHSDDGPFPCPESMYYHYCNL
jgi:hypothetical protein